MVNAESARTLGLGPSPTLADGLTPPYRQSFPLLVVKLIPRHSGSLGRLLVRGLDNPDVLRALSCRD